MVKFKVNDKVNGIEISTYNNSAESVPNSMKTANYGFVKNYCSATNVQVWNHDRSDWWPYKASDLTLFNNGELNVKRRTFKLTKELPELTKGALVQEKCDDGTQDYIALDNSQIKYTLEDGRKSLTYPRKAVEDEPNYFVEVFAVEPAYMTQDELDRFEAFKTTKAGQKSTARPVKTEAPTPKKRAPRAKKRVDVETFVRVYNSSRNSTSVVRKLGINVGNVYNRASLARKQGFKLKTMKRPNTKVA
ncbi:hypothetical protein [Rhodococcus sp. FH8]|jgi:hypothetical protein|uniref:hypothetical protein n=1 Tax=Rhodococcus sp. FH8 TaxID=1761013 RepID=UPI001C4E48E5|nr:hypothetical protein [Rhodococcus sp. FH8]